MIPVILSIFLILLGIITIFFSLWAFSKKTASGALEFALFMLFTSFYTFGYALEILNTEISCILLTVKFQYTGISYITFFVILFSYKFATGKSLNKRIMILLLVIPFLSMLAVYTTEWNDFFYINPHVIEGEFFPVFSYTKGPLYIVRYIFQQITSVICIIYLILKAAKSEKERRHQLLFLILAQIVPGVVVLSRFAGIAPYGIDLNPFSTFIISVLFAVAILKFGLFQVVPHARELALNSIGEAFILINKNLMILDSNKAAHKLNFVHIKLGNFLSINNTFTKKLVEAISNNRLSFEYTNTTKDSVKSYYTVNLYKLKHLKDSSGARTIIIHDSTETTSLVKKLEYKARYDYLTDLKNRRAIIKSGIREIEISKRNNTPLTFIMVDIDHFKNINDTYGHLAGDKVLIELAKTLKLGLRNIDLVGRYGGEEFLIICPNTNKSDGIKTAERLRILVTEISIIQKKYTLTATCSFGVFTSVGGDIIIDKLIYKADKALYVAKNNGRNQVCY